MRTPTEFLSAKGIKSNKDHVNVPQVKEWLVEYAQEAIGDTGLIAFQYTSNDGTKKLTTELLELLKTIKSETCKH